MKRRELLALLALAPIARGLAAAEPAWPARPVRIIVPGGVGGVIDLRARWLASRLTAQLGEPVVVENRPGAGGNIGMEAGAHSAPDGYTLLMVHQGTMTVNPHLYRELKYDPLRDLAPLTRIGYGPLMLAVSPALPVHSVQELIALAKARRLNYGTPGVGTPPHIATELFLHMVGAKATHVPYKGGGQAVTDLIAGVTDFEIEGLTVLGPQVKAGHVRALAITGDERSAAFPEVPTLREAGLPDYDFFGWVGIALPAATPGPIARKVHDAVARVLDTDDARAWFATFAANPAPDTQEAFARVIRDEYARWGRVIREAGITAQ